jgi:hypothetical protein
VYHTSNLIGSNACTLQWTPSNARRAERTCCYLPLSPTVCCQFTAVTAARPCWRGTHFANVIARAGARRYIVCSNGQPRPESTAEDRRAEHAAAVRDAMGPPLLPPPPQERHRRRRYRVKHRYRSEMQRLKRHLKLKATK